MINLQNLIGLYRKSTNVRKGSRAKHLAEVFDITPFEVRQLMVNNNVPLIGIDVLAYRRQTMSVEEKRQFNEMIAPHRAKFWENISDEDREWRSDLFSKKMKATISRLRDNPEAYKHWRDTHSAALIKTYETTDCTSRISASVKAYYADLSPTERIARRQACKLYGEAKTINGKKVWFDSSWELAMYNQLVLLKEEFKYANEEDTAIKLTKGEKRIWLPDFVLPKRELILEVKGHPNAKAKWDDYDLPNILVNEIKYKIYLVTHSVSGYSSLEELLADSELVNK
jgi:hypothetical protein